jgi:hypothetical protein
MGEFLARVDAEKNRIYFKITGYLTLDQAEQLREDYRSAVARCKPGFTVLTDVVDYKPGSPEVQDIVVSCAEIDGNAGCSKVARVVGNKPLGGMQIDRLASSVATYPARHFSTVAEAEAYLDSD